MKYLLLGTAGCHLCELAEGLIAECQTDKSNNSVELIDIAEQTQWQEDFAINIPVLLHPESGQFIHWPFSKEDILTFISQNYD